MVRRTTVKWGERERCKYAVGYFGEVDLPLTQEGKAVIYRLHFRMTLPRNTIRYRIDILKPCSSVWEAIDDGINITVVTRGKQHVNRWLTAAREQQTLTPTL